MLDKQASNPVIIN